MLDESVSLAIDGLDSFRHNKQSLLQIIKADSWRMIDVPGIDKNMLLLALAGKESSFGVNNVPRHEKAYDKEGRYYKLSEHLRASVRRYGLMAACSWSPWQIMYIAACEMNYKGHPVKLIDAETSLPYVIRFINERIIEKGANTLELIADAYNSGTHLDKNVPTDYIESLKKIYWDLVLERL